MEGIFEQLKLLALNYGLQVLGSIAILIIGRWVARWLVKVTDRLLRRSKVDPTLVSFFTNILYYLLIALIVVAALNNLGIPTTSIVAILGAATLAVGLALQDSLGNMAAGVVIIFLRPYNLDDYVEISGEAGFVTEIQLFHTVLTTRDNKSILMPNKDVLDNNIINYSKTELIRLDLVYGIGYSDDLLKAKRILLEITQADGRVAKDPPPQVVVKELGDNSVNFSVRPYVRVRDETAVTFAITEQVKLRFDAEGISIPFPQRDVHLFQAN
ncbi:MAG: mechanosensitive ion channel domain-containing protein [Candidatus Promineifilaceae bacterium]